MLFLLYQPSRNIAYKINHAFRHLLQYHLKVYIFLLYHHFSPFLTGHATVSRTRWYPVQYPLIFCTVYRAKTFKYTVHTTAIRGIVYITVKIIFEHQTHHFNSMKSKNKMMLNTIMTAANTCYSWKIFNAVVWIQVCWASNGRDNGHGEWGLLVSFVDGYCTAYGLFHPEAT